ncbi:MAG TPA: hypothetical protein PKK23_03695 [Nitrospirales bacterium]|nr:hypothetical protein [Nitrospirales bacterium]
MTVVMRTPLEGWPRPALCRRALANGTLPGDTVLVRSLGPLGTHSESGRELA